MDIRPADLGARRHRAIVEQRAERARQGRRMHLASKSNASRPLGLLGKLWTGGTSLDDESAAHVLRNGSVRGTLVPLLLTFGAAMPVMFLPAMIAASHEGSPVPALFMGTMMTGFTLAGWLGPRSILKNWSESPVTAAEVDDFLAGALDPLEKAFLALVRDVLQHEDLPERAVAEVRASLTALSEAMERLPSAFAETIDAAGLRAEADRLATEAAAETDRLTAESQERQADALRRRADNAERAQVTLRRTKALRGELLAQIEGLREGLAGLKGDASATGAADLTLLAESVRRVAAEASSADQARAEIEQALGRRA